MQADVVNDSKPSLCPSGSGVQWLSQGFMFLLLTGAADIKQTPGNLEMSKHFLFLLCMHGGLFTVLLARHLHTENIFKFFSFYGAASFCTASTPRRDFDETLQKGKSSLAVKSQVMEQECQLHCGHSVRFALGKAVRVARLWRCSPRPGQWALKVGWRRGVSGLCCTSLSHKGPLEPRLLQLEPLELHILE